MKMIQILMYCLFGYRPDAWTVLGGLESLPKKYDKYFGWIWETPVYFVVKGVQGPKCAESGEPDYEALPMTFDAVIWKRDKRVEGVIWDGNLDVPYIKFRISFSDFLWFLENQVRGMAEEEGREIYRQVLAVIRRWEEGGQR